MWYLAAFFKECFLGTLEAIAAAIEASEFLYLVQGRLLAELINKHIGAVIRALPLSGSITIGGISYSLEGPQFVANALVAAAEQLVKIFKDRVYMRTLQNQLDEEAGNKEINAKLIF
jgi:hypothetical protein